MNRQLANILRERLISNVKYSNILMIDSDTVKMNRLVYLHKLRTGELTVSSTTAAAVTVLSFLLIFGGRSIRVNDQSQFLDREMNVGGSGFGSDDSVLVDF